MDATSHTKALFVALWDYEAQEEDELALVKGDMICASVDFLENSFGEWMSGENFRGQHGKFPASYVKAVTAGATELSAPLAMNAKFGGQISEIQANATARRASYVKAKDGQNPTISKRETALRKFLREKSAHHYLESLLDLGVECIRDLNLVLPKDLREMGMDEATIQNVLAGTPSSNSTASSPTHNQTSTSQTTNTGRQSPVNSVEVSKATNSHRQRSIARSIVDALSPVELVKVKEYIFTPESLDSSAANPHQKMFSLKQLNVLLEYSTAQFEVCWLALVI